MATILEEEVVIIGAGIAGLAVLERLGIRALVLERADGLRATGAAITLFPNAWRALDALGVSHKLTSIYVPTKRGFVTNLGTGATQEISFAGTSEIGSEPRYVHRIKLLQALADELPMDTIHFSAKVAAIETESLEGSFVHVVHLGDGTIIKAKILIGCDGVHSTVARWLGLSAPVESGRSAIRGLTVFPEGHGLNRDVRQFVDAGIRAGYVALNEKEIYWFHTYNSSPKGENRSANPELIQKELLENYAEIFPPLFLDIIRHCDLSTLTEAPTVFRYPWDIMFGNLRKGNVTVTGDAMHPMTPDLGQGGCLALEDAVVLGRHIGNSLIKHKGLVSGGIGEVLDGYIKERRWRVTWLVAGSYLSGWAQIGGSKWWKKFLRDVIFYKLLFPKLVNVVGYDCGKLPRVTFAGESDNSK
ncbi:FAD-dependent urate hydroxylase [Melia azedarach]|uniref:FAD-dependent urate hydroxylase n=1 Tax=Melia azedarach TaxID=155640 RepID=A0ACC1XXI3_MELAZ|nr:FAD-dependent urate hydroxylase [Melia azedarach]